jgi:DNA primase
MIAANRIDFGAIHSAAPLSSIIGAAVQLKRKGHEWNGRCPFHDEKTPSFYVNDAKGKANCFGCGWHGDALDFVTKLHGVSLREAVGMIDAGALPTVKLRPIPAAADADRMAEALSIWCAAGSAEGTPADAYLRGRGIDIAIPDCFRFARLRLGRRGPMPALVALIAGPDDRPCGIQRTFLTEEGRKADLPDGKVKFSLGRVKGGAIRLTPGASELILCEGAEDGLSLVQMFGRGVWVAGGTAMLPAMRLPEGVSSVVIAADNDKAGAKAASDAAEAFAREGRKVRTIRPLSPHKDFNEELMKEAR